MPNLRDIRHRIKSVQNTAQLTRAMQMVAASKMRRAQEAALIGRPYARQLCEALRTVIPHAGGFTHPLAEQRPLRTQAVILVSTDKGLCGALNGNLMREAATYDTGITHFVSAGRKASQFLTRTHRRLLAEFTYRDTPLFSEARAISRFVRDLFLKGEVDRVEVLFTEFVSTLVQRTRKQTFLPICDLPQLASGAGSAAPEPNHAAAPANGSDTIEFAFEPNAAEVFDALLPHHLNNMIYQILLEAKASEHSARMVAMKNATDNARELQRDLTLDYNQLRQANITRELLEITSASMAAS